MTIRIYKPTTPGRRHASVNLHVEVTKKTPEKSLLAPIHKTGGRNNQGKITVQGRGGGHKRRYRVIDFKRTKDDMVATIIGIQELNIGHALIADALFCGGLEAAVVAYRACIDAALTAR